MAKIKIDLQNKLLEIEGEENFIKEIYPQAKGLVLDQVEILSQKIIAKKQTRPGIIKESYAIVKNLDLNQPSLKECFAKKKLETALEKNTFFVYFLEKIAGINNIGLDHIYTCYKELGEKMPNALKQSLADTSSKKGWIDTRSMSNIHITTRGESLIEHGLEER